MGKAAQVGKHAEKHQGASLKVTKRQRHYPRRFSNKASAR